MTVSRPRLVVFDAGGVIVQVAGPWNVAQARAGIVMTDRIATPEFASAQSALADQHQRGELDSATYFQRAAEVAGLTPVEVEQIIDAWIDDEYPGWSEVLDHLAAAGVTTALLSNTNAHHWRVMVPNDVAAGRYPAIGRLRHHFASHLIGAMKPDQATFAAVEAKTGVYGQDVLFFDDLQDNVDGAQRFGWRAILIDPDADPARQVLLALRAIDNMT